MRDYSSDLGGGGDSSKKFAEAEATPAPLKGGFCGGSQIMRRRHSGGYAQQERKEE